MESYQNSAGIGPGQFSARVNGGVTEPNPKSIPEALATQERELANLVASLGRLAERLEPVLRQQPPSTAEKRQERGATCGIAQALFQKADEMNQLCQLAENLLSRLEV